MRAAAQGIPPTAIGTLAQQALHDTRQSVHRRHVQGSQSALVGMVDRNILAEQALEHGQQDVFVTGRAGFGARAEQQQQGCLADGIGAVRRQVGHQQQVEQGQHALYDRGR